MKKVIIENVGDFVDKHIPFLDYLKEMESGLTPLNLDEIIGEAGDVEAVAVISVDMIEGFCRKGILSSPRVQGLIEPIVNLFKLSHEKGVKNFALTQDHHPPDAEEFGSFPPHCTSDSEEAETITELKSLDFFDKITVIHKNTISSGIDTDLEKWLVEREIPLKKIIVVGDCTDLCTYQLAMFVKLLSNSRGYKWDVIMPANCVETYDLPVEIARSIGAVPHPGDFIQMLFLYHMKLNGIRLVEKIK